MHTYLHMYIFTYIHASMHTYLVTYLDTYSHNIQGVSGRMVSFYEEIVSMIPSKKVHVQTKKKINKILDASKFTSI